MDLKDKVVIVTGASSGIGAAAARLFAADGAAVVLGARRQAKLNAVVAAIVESGGSAAALAGDVSDEAYAEALVALAVNRFGRLDGAFNNAGITGALGPVTEMSLQNWNDVLAVNLTASFLCAKHQIAAMAAQGGAIVFNASFVGHTIGLPGMVAYAAAKAGLIGMTQVLAAEHGAAGIRVNALLPGGTRTPMAGDDPAVLESIASIHALRRLAEPEEIARVALFLLSDKASFVTGSAIIADGGNSIFKG